MRPTPRELLDAAARTRLPHNLDLYPRLSARLEKKTFVQALGAKPALLVLSVLLALALLTGAAYALGRLAGFIPGFGFTDDTSAVYVLEEPVQVEHDGVVIRVDNAVSARDKFWVGLSVNGEYDADRRFHANTVVILPGGTELQCQFGQEGDQSAAPRRASYEFPALPVGTVALALRYEEVIAADGTALWSVDIPLRLRPIRANELIPAPETPAAPLQSETYDGVTLALDNVAPASDKTVLQVSLRFDQPGVSLNSDWNVTLGSDDGKIYPLTEVLSDSNNRSKTYETLPFRGGEALTLALAAFPDAGNLPMSVDIPVGQAAFTFDPGSNPQVGQSWKLDEQVQVGKYTVRVIGVKLVSPTELLFEFAPASGVTGVMLYSPLARGATGGVPAGDASFTAGLSFAEMPGQPVVISVIRVGYTAHGQWQINWQAPAAPEGVIVGPTGTPLPTAAVFATPTFVSSDPLLLEVQALVQRFDASFRQGPGWVYIITETEISPRAGQTFPPPYITSEQWQKLDAEGYVIRTLHIDRDKDGNVIQQVVTIGNYSINFTTGDSGYNEYSRYPFSTDMLTQDLNVAAQYQTKVTREEVTCDDGSPCLLITLFNAFSQETQNPAGSQLLAGMGRRTWVNLETGQQVVVQAFSRFQDGSEKIDNTSRTLMIEKVDTPPDEVLKIIDGVVAP